MHSPVFLVDHYIYMLDHRGQEGRSSNRGRILKCSVCEAKYLYLLAPPDVCDLLDSLAIHHCRYAT